MDQTAFFHQLIDLNQLPGELVDLEEYEGIKEKPVDLFEGFIDFFLPGFSEEELHNFPHAYQIEVKEEIQRKFGDVLKTFSQEDFASFSEMEHREQRKQFLQAKFYQNFEEYIFPDGSLLSHAILLEILLFFQRKMYDTLDEVDGPLGDWAVRYGRQFEGLTDRMEGVAQQFSLQEIRKQEEGLVEDDRGLMEVMQFKNTQIEETVSRYKAGLDRLKVRRERVQNSFEKAQKDQGNYAKLFLSYYDKLHAITSRILSSF